MRIILILLLALCSATPAHAYDIRSRMTMVNKPDDTPAVPPLLLCTPQKSYICTPNGCRHAINKEVMRIDLTEDRFRACPSCKEVPLTANPYPDHWTVVLNDNPRFIRLALGGTTFTDSAMQGENTLIRFGTCASEAPAEPVAQ